jgi:predicted PhzF superfamily epimerase YddE/YHI9
MNRRYVTVDVFTERPFGGNPLAVVLDAEGLTTAQMQSIATEFNYSESTFVLPAREFDHTAHVRIFTPKIEVPFAGHPNVGTAVVLAREWEANGRAPADRFVFEEAAGLVSMRLLRDGGVVVGAELTAPERLSIRSSISVNDAAACLSLASSDMPFMHTFEDPDSESCTLVILRRSTPPSRIRLPAAPPRLRSHSSPRCSQSATLSFRGGSNKEWIWVVRAFCWDEQKNATASSLRFV